MVAVGEPLRALRLHTKPHADHCSSEAAVITADPGFVKPRLLARFPPLA